MIRNLLHWNRLICRCPFCYLNSKLDRLAKDVIARVEWIWFIWIWSRSRLLRIHLTSTLREVESINILLASFPVCTDSYSCPIVISLSRIYTCAILCSNLNLQSNVSTIIGVGLICFRCPCFELLREEHSVPSPIIVAASAVRVFSSVAYSTA